MILRLILFISIFLNVCIAFGQKEVNNVLTAGHLPVSGTKVSLIPPNGFEKAANFTGFQQTQSGSSIMVMSIPGPAAKVQAGLSKEAFMSQGVEISEIEKLTFNGMPALFLTGTQNAHGNVYTKLILCFGTDQESVMINGAFPQNLQEVGKVIRQSMFGAYFDAGKKVDPFEALDFAINIAGSKMVFAKNVAGSLVYNVDGKLPTESVDRTSFIIAKSLSKMQLEDKKLYCLNRIKQLYPGIAIDSVSELSVDGISGYEVSGDFKGKEGDQNEKIYQAILFSDNLYYIMIGYSNSDFTRNLEIFRSLARTFKRK